MKFISRRDTTFKLIFAAITALLALLIGESFLFLDFSSSYVFVFDSILLVIWLFLFWIFLDTRYEIGEEELIYRSGPLYGKIPIKGIKKIIVGKTSWSGKKIALAQKGLVIEYMEEKQIYISPKTNDSFTSLIEKINPSIEIEHYQRYILK